MKNNRLLIVLVVILVFLVLGLSGFIVYDKVLRVGNYTDSEYNNDIDVDNDINNSSDKELLSNNEALIIVKELTKKYFDYRHSLGPYCGETNSGDYISFGSYETHDFRDYIASNTFRNINNIKWYYNSIMTDELMPSYLNDGVSYIEQDGKLYCLLSHKGCREVYKEESSTFNIISIDNYKIIFDVTLSSETCGPMLSKRKGTIEIIKNKDSNWVISKYDVQISDID